MFIQHILYSLKDNGKAAIVVPTGFITAQSGIEKKIREEMVAKKMLKGVISMPSNIFANTGTNVSVIFLDKANTSNDVLLVDASNLGTKIKDGSNQKTVLSAEEIDKIINTFINRDVIEDFSVKVTYEQITEKNYSFSAGQYFDVKIEYVEITQEEYDKMIEDFNIDFANYVEETKKFQENIKKQLGGLKLTKWGDKT
jgi:type I restriction enzyme M protein